MAKTKTLDDFLREYYLFPDQAFSINERKAVESYVAYREQQASAKAFEEGKNARAENIWNFLKKRCKSPEEMKGACVSATWIIRAINDERYTGEIVNPYKTDNNENAE